MKTTMKTGLATLTLLLVFSCKKEPLSTPPSLISKTQDEASAKTVGHYIGERFGGGVIFWMNGDSLHGLIADTVDFEISTGWSLESSIIIGAAGTAIGTGRSNTRRIVLSQGKMGDYAALFCSRSERNGYSDWVLPSKDELNQLFKRRKLVGGFIRDLNNSWYWSSSESYGVGYGSAWAQNFVDGSQWEYASKLGWCYVRAIRGF